MGFRGLLGTMTPLLVMHVVVGRPSDRSLVLHVSAFADLVLAGVRPHVVVLHCVVQQVLCNATMKLAARAIRKLTQHLKRPVGRDPYSRCGQTKLVEGRRPQRPVTLPRLLLPCLIDA